MLDIVQRCTVSSLVNHSLWRHTHCSHITNEAPFPVVFRESQSGRLGFKPVSQACKDGLCLCNYGCWVPSASLFLAPLCPHHIARLLTLSFSLSGEQLTQGLKLSPSQVQTLLLWGAAALVIYWLLSLLLGLVLALLGRILGGLKLVLFVAGFVALVRSVPDPSTRALMLLALLTLFALLSRLTGSRSSGSHLEAKVRGLERQIEELRGRQRRAAKMPRSMEEE